MPELIHGESVICKVFKRDFALNKGKYEDTRTTQSKSNTGKALRENKSTAANTEKKGNYVIAKTVD